jgi:oligopeptide transport system substrate-binding protein
MHKKLISILILVSIFIGIKIKYFSASQDLLDTELHLTVSDQLKTFDPAVLFNDDGLIVLSQALDTLYQYHYLKRPYELIPALADGLPLIQDKGRVYTIKIKKDVFYHEHDSIPSNRTVVADDFIMAIKRIAFKSTKSTGGWLFSGKLKGFDEFSKVVGDDWQNMFKYEIEGLKALDDHTLRIELLRPEPNLLNFLAMTFTSPTPKELVYYTKNDLSTTILGTGAYVFEKFEDNQYSFSRFDKFRKEYYPTTGDRYANVQNLLTSSAKQLPFISRLKFHVIKDDLEKWERLLKGEIDLANLPLQHLSKVVNNIKDFESTLKDKNLELKHFSRMSTRWIGLNLSKTVTSRNKNLRLAIAHAIDFDRYINFISQNTNLRANSIYNPSITGYDPTYEPPYRYDIEKAKSFLKKAKLSKSEKVMTFTTRSKKKVHLDEAKFFQEALKKIGLELKIEQLEFSDFLKKGRAGELQMWVDNWIYDYPDGENIVQLLISKNSPGINKSAYKNPVIDDLYNKLVVSESAQERRQILRVIEREVNKDIPWIMLMYESIYIGHKDDIKNFRKSFFIRNYPKYLKRVDN